MQFSHYLPDEVIGSNGLRPESTLAVDYKFAKAAVDEKSALLSRVGLKDKSQSGQKKIRQAFKGTGKMAIVWVIEIFTFVFTVFFIAYEFWTSCTRDVGLSHCYGCYTSSFITWSMIWLFLWIVHLYTFLLLVSRDFEMYIGGGLLSELMTNVLDRAIPRQGIVFYVAESVLLALWWIIGLCVLISSNSCLRGGRIYGDVGRSGLMFWWMLWNLVIWVPLMIFGRFTMSPPKYIYGRPVEEEEPILRPRPEIPPPQVPPQPPVMTAQPVIMTAVPQPVPMTMPMPVQQPVMVPQPVPMSMPMPMQQPMPVQSMPALPRVNSAPNLAYGSAPPLTMGAMAPGTGSLKLS